MRTTSVIFLIFSLVIIIAGVSVCYIASSMADSEGSELFYGENGKSGMQNYDFGIDGITSITLELENCDVMILGGSERSYIEFVNYPGGIFGYSVEGKEFFFNDSLAISSFDDVTHLFVSFEGIRHYLKLDEYFKNDLEIIIHVADELPPKVMKITTKNGSITAKNMSSLTDYILSTENGDITADSIIGASLGSFESKKGNVSVLSSDFSTLSVKAENNAEVSVNDISVFSYDLTSKNGSVYVNDSKKSGSFAGAGLSAEKTIAVEAENGYAKLSY